MRAHLHTLLWVALVAHVALGLARLPKAWQRRTAEVEAWRTEGPARFLDRTAFLQGAEAIEELARTTPPDAVIPWRGDAKNAVEFAPSLLWPRLLVAEQSVPASSSTWRQRPVALWQGGPRQAVLVAEGKALRLVPR